MVFCGVILMELSNLFSKECEILDIIYKKLKILMTDRSK